MDEIRPIDANALKEELKQYFTDGTLDSVSAKLAFNMILRKIDEAPTVKYPFYQEAFQSGYEEGKNERPQVFDNCDMNVFEPEKFQTPSCLTNPERQAELLERYKEE